MFAGEGKSHLGWSLANSPDLPAPHLAPEGPLSQRGAAGWGQLRNGAPGGDAVGLEHVGYIFGKLWNVAGVCRLGVNGQDGACRGDRELRRTEDT